MTLLAQRDHSEVELRRKLTRIARSAVPDEAGRPESVDVAATAASANIADMADMADRDDMADDTGAEAIHQQVDDVLAWLRQQGYLDEARFVESRVHARSARWGQRRIEQELAQHGLSLDAEQRSALGETEFARAFDLLRRKFGSMPLEDAATEAATEARQMRFLLGRGFSAELARRAIRAVRAGESAQE